MPTGKFDPKPVSHTVNGEVKTWCGRGRKPKWLLEVEAAQTAATTQTAPAATPAPAAE